MLTELSIENFAIIDRLLVRFSPGFTVLTGETGAGKSILIDALQASLGARVPADVVRAGAPFASVEAIYDPAVLRDPALADILRTHGIEDDDCLILRRDINASGRGSARINGRAVPQAVLSAIGDVLVDIHGQSDHLSVLRRERQLDVLDRYGNLMELRAAVSETVRTYHRLERELRDLTASQRDAEQRLDLLHFQVGEIESAELRPGEDKDLIAERNLLANAERLTQHSSSAYGSLEGDAPAAVDAISAAETAMLTLIAIDPALQTLNDRLVSVHYEIDDIAQDLRRYRDGVEYDPQRLIAVEERLDLLTHLQRKYGSTLEEVIAFGSQARQSMEEVESLDERIGTATENLRAAATRAARHAEALSGERGTVAAKLTKAMAKALQGLGLKGTNFEAVLSRNESAAGLEFSDGKQYALSQTGVDAVTFLASFNPGEPLRPLDKVASGGETSRFLLALKGVLADSDRTPTLVFDEVDVGVGGRHGLVVGERLKALSANHQVLSITHLPQVAALADQHLRVEKMVADGRTGVAVRALNAEDRQIELAEMMSGSDTETARQSARELLEAAQEGTGRASAS